MNQTKLLFPLIFISLEDEPWEPIEPNPNAAPAEEPVAAEPGLSESDWTLASTETVTHEYLAQSGKVVRETITTSMDTTTLDFFYDESGRPFAFNYTPEGSTPNTYYYILNLQGDVVQIIDGKLMPPFVSIDGMGEKAAEAVEEAAKDGPYLSRDDFRQRTKASKTVIDYMAELGLLGDLPESNHSVSGCTR